MKTTYQHYGKMVLDTVYDVSWPSSSANPVMLIRLYKKLLPALEEGELQDFHNEISKPEILDMKMLTKVRLKKGYKVMHNNCVSST
jgi:hypothetical protein